MFNVGQIKQSHDGERKQLTQLREALKASLQAEQKEVGNPPELQPHTLNPKPKLYGSAGVHRTRRRSRAQATASISCRETRPTAPSARGSSTRKVRGEWTPCPRILQAFL